MTAVALSRLRPRLSQDVAPPVPFSGRLPVREHLRPKDGWPLAIEGDVDPLLLSRFTRIVQELNAVPNKFYEGPGRPGRGWAGWHSGRELFGKALALPWAGEA